MKRFILSSLLVAAISLTAVPAFAQNNCDTSLNYNITGTEQYVAGDYSDALNSFSCAVSLDPESAVDFNWRGNVYRQLGNLDLALADYTQAVTLDEDYAIAFNNRGWIYYSLDNLDAALDDFNTAITLDGNLAYAYNNRGLVQHIRGNAVSAVADFERAIDLGLETNWAEYNLARAQLDANQAVPVAATTTVDANATRVQNLLAQADSSYDARDFSGAVSLYSQVIALDPNNADAFYYRGRSYITLDNPSAALFDFEQMVRILPDFVYGYWERSVARAELGLFDAALMDAQRAEAMDPEHVNNFITQGTIAALMGDVQTAGEEFEGLMQAWEEERIVLDDLTTTETMTVNMQPRHVFETHFDGEAGQVISINAESTQADPIIVLLDANGTPIAGDDDSGISLNSLINDFSLPENGTYTLLISHAGGGYQGEIVVSLR